MTIFCARCGGTVDSAFRCHKCQHNNAPYMASSTNASGPHTVGHLDATGTFTQPTPPARSVEAARKKVMLTACLYRDPAMDASVDALIASVRAATLADVREIAGRWIRAHQIDDAAGFLAALDALSAEGK